VHHGVGPGAAAGLELLRRRLHGDDPRAGPAGEHDLLDAEPAAGAEDGHGLSGPGAGPAIDLVRGGERAGDDADLRRMRPVVEAAGQREEVPRRELHVLGIAAVALLAHIAPRALAEGLEVPQAHPAAAAEEVVVGRHRLTHGQPRDARAHLDDLRGDLVADDARAGHRDAPGLVVLDREPRPAGEHARHLLPGPGDGVGHALQGEGGAGHPEDQRLHAGFTRRT
jgi:hypothetical protein